MQGILQSTLHTFSHLILTRILTGEYIHTYIVSVL